MAKKKPGRPPEYMSRRNKRTVKDELTEDRCTHRGHVTVETNRNQRQFKECTRCGAFLGWL